MLSPLDDTALLLYKYTPQFTCTWTSSFIPHAKMGVPPFDPLRWRTKMEPVRLGMWRAQSHFTNDLRLNEHVPPAVSFDITLRVLPCLQTRVPAGWTHTSPVLVVMALHCGRVLTVLCSAPSLSSSLYNDRSSSAGS